MKKILHLHIPKTGGTALQHHLVEQLGKERVSDTIVGRRLRDALVQFDYLDVIGGHFTLRHGDRLPQDRCCITVLRHPLDRFLSEYFYHKIDCADRILDTRLHGLSLDAYLERLSLNDQEGLAAQIGMLYPLGTVSQTIIPFEEKFAAAVKAIDAFELIGVQDELEDFGCILDARFGWKYIPLKLKNVTSQRISVDSLSPLQLQKLSSLFSRELELYQYAKSRFQALRRDYLKRSIAVANDDEEDVGPSAASALESTGNEQALEFGDRRCTIEEAGVSGEISGGSLAMVGEYFDISLKIKANEPIDALNTSIAIKDERGLLMFSASSMLLGHVHSLGEGEHVVRFSMLNRLPRGNYQIDAALTKGENHYLGCYHWRENVASFIVHDSIVAHFEGHIFMDADVSLKSVAHASASERKLHMAAGNQVRSLGRVNKPLLQFDSIITPIAPIENIFPDMDICVPVRIENNGQEVWAATGKQPVTLAYRWRARDGKIVVADGMRTRLPSDVRPGGAIVVPMQIRTPSEPHSLELVMSLVQESVAWFVDKNHKSAHVIPVELG